jgi:aryl-alcohol dehydrogenase-like predicted oxidoreductase
MTVVLVDYGSGNLRSLRAAMERAGSDVVVSDDPGTVAGARRLMVPGQGAAGPTMATLRRTGLEKAIREAIGQGAYLLGVCVGLQLLFDSSAEDDATCLATIERAIELGVNFVDVANVYGAGRSERLVGAALKGRRDRLVVSTKFGSQVGPGPDDSGGSRAHVTREIDRSLARLGTDYVDLYLLHHPDPRTPVEETLRALEDLVRQGKVRYAGCCNFSPAQVAQALEIGDRLHVSPFACVQNYYNLLDRSLESEMLPFCRARGLGVMAYSPLAIGLLSGRFRSGTPPPPDTPWGQGRVGFAEAMPPAADRVIDTLARIGRERGKTVAQVAIAWVLSQPGITVALIGPDSPEHVSENVGGAGWQLSAEARGEIDAASGWTVATPCGHGG